MRLTGKYPSAAVKAWRWLVRPQKLVCVMPACKACKSAIGHAIQRQHQPRGQRARLTAGRIKSAAATSHKTRNPRFFRLGVCFCVETKIMSQNL